MFTKISKIGYNMLGGDIMEQMKILTTMEEVKAFSDPFRYKILMTFYRMKKPATVKEIAVAIDEVPANVHYHIKKLEKVGILKLVYTKEINGIIAKYYQPTAETFTIECSPEVDAAGEKLILAEGQKMFAQLYDDSKNIALEQLSHISDVRDRHFRTISMEDVYLTEEEAKEFVKYISDFLDKHKNDDKNIEGINKYHCFSSIFWMK